MPNVAICMPAGDEVKTFFAFDYARLMCHTIIHRPDVKQYPLIATGSLIPKQRQTLVNTVLEQTDATHILWLDSDLRFPKDALLRLLAHGVPAVCASYTERNAPFRPVAFADPNNYDLRVWPTEDKTGLQPIAACGSGLMLIETDVYRKIGKPAYMVGYNPVSHAYIGEDIYFCMKLREVGHELMLDNDLTRDVAHIGRFEFGVDHAVRAARQRGDLPLEGDGTGQALLATVAA